MDSKPVKKVEYKIVNLVKNKETTDKVDKSVTYSLHSTTKKFTPILN